ncbi:50S ribosomal protein L25/general stress protein Ctc [Spongiibacter sp. KMU-158]|uniref:Large ribosomal subunit protein bL25 n=1 Tax=Spongiibacter pelagi TaxID=2760804 RepID=A0A927C2Q1_9GAMM|nr:50S ribosomal protein L25/general stress protein Ctc [Spongiibacter pelagi]MBD2858747.1 50S ribosomal protein L25/general stress protein Ctc [Spongiibacter pelagi]
MSEFTINAQARTDAGKGASRRLRREEGLVPGIIYGGSKEPQNISLAHKDLVWFLDDEAFFTSVLTLNLDGSNESVVLKDLQRHPAKAQILHADFLRVSADTKLTLHVPLHFINEESCVGVKMQGGNITHALTDLEITCLPKDLPEFIEVDLKEVEAGTTLHLSDLVLPAGVEIPALALGEDHDTGVVTVHNKRGGNDDAAEEETASEE